MAFDDVRLPVDVETGAVGGPAFSTTVLSLGSGQEQRVQNWLQARHSYNIGYGVQSIADLQAVAAFFFARRGKARGFRFKDWSDYSATWSPITTDGTNVAYLTKRYDDGSGSVYDRPITRIVPDTLIVKVGNTIATGVTESFGQLTFASAPMLAVTASFEFDIPVRFDVDQLDKTVYNVDAVDVPQINIIEILESSLKLNGL